MPRTAIAQIAKLIGQELESAAGPSEQALATGPMLAEADAFGNPVVDCICSVTDENHAHVRHPRWPDRKSPTQVRIRLPPPV